MEVKVKEENPAFTKLLDVLSNSYLQDSVLRTTTSRYKQVESRLCSVRQHYLEQLVFSSELTKVLHSHTNLPAPECTAAAELQHCLEVCPEMTLLGVQEEHVKAANPLHGITKSNTSIYNALEQRLTSKCKKVVRWHGPERTTGTDGFELARIGQLPQLLRQQKEEIERHKMDIQQKRQECDEKLNTKLKILSEMCSDLKHAVENYKLGTMAEANQLTLSHMQTQCQAMLGKLDVMYHQLLKGICSDGRLQALQEIRSQLYSARQKMEQRLLQTQQALQQYQNLGDEFVSLAQQYHELLSDIENKQWALSELGKSSKQ